MHEHGRDHLNAPVSTSGTCKGQCVLETYFRGDPRSPGPALGLVDSKGAAALGLHNADPRSPLQTPGAHHPFSLARLGFPGAGLSPGDSGPGDGRRGNSTQGAEHEALTQFPLPYLHASLASG